MKDDISNITEVLRKYHLGNHSIGVDRINKVINVYCEESHSTFKYFGFDVVFHGSKEEEYNFFIDDV